MREAGIRSRFLDLYALPGFRKEEGLRTCLHHCFVSFWLAAKMLFPLHTFLVSSLFFFSLQHIRKSYLLVSGIAFRFLRLSSHLPAPPFVFLRFSGCSLPAGGFILLSFSSSLLLSLMFGSFSSLTTYCLSLFCSLYLVFYSRYKYTNSINSLHL
jgi:hypothetical protein